LKSKINNEIRENLMGQRLAGRRIVVTGGARGIGAAMAEAMAKEGASLVIADLNGEAAAKTASALEALGGGRSASRSMSGAGPPSSPWLGAPSSVWRPRRGVQQCRHSSGSTVSRHFGR
jgi:NAD(P)-dependent dehydrogenase (short-subunit alcohol dehydrogenase family)